MDKKNDSEPTDGTPPVDDSPHHPVKHRHTILIALFVLVIAAGSAFGVYESEQSKASKVVSLNSSLNTQAISLNKEIKQQTDTNNGVGAPGSVYKDPAGGIGLVNGAITLTLPSGWVRVPADLCTGGTIDSTIVCQDIAAVAPKSLVKPDGTASWSVPIKVFGYTSSNGSAENWLYSDYEGGYSTGAIDVSSSPINGYNAYSYEYQAFDIYGPAPEYTQAYYAVVHGKYGLVIDTMIQSGSSPSQQGSYDYRATYQPQIEQMLKTIKFQD